MCIKIFVLKHTIHYPDPRTLKRNIYSLKQLYRQIFNIENAINNEDIIEIRKILKEAQNFSLKYINKILIDPPSIVCTSCERLFTEKNITNVQVKKIYAN